MSGSEPAPRRGTLLQHRESVAPDSFRNYLGYLTEAERLRHRGDLQSASVYAAVAAHVALQPHPGFFAAQRLERLLVEIGSQSSRRSAYLRILDPKRRLRSILHVATELPPTGGLADLLSRWIRADRSRLHSLALTNHAGPLHAGVAMAVEHCGGQMLRLNRTVGGLIERAIGLRELARGYDAVVLHVYGQDVVPVIAFAEPARRPPVLLHNHADHLFWLGVAISDVVINTRDAAQELALARRGVEQRRSALVPTLIEPALRTRTREQAKRELGVDPGAVLLFSAAPAMNYRTVEGRSFADTHVDLLRRHASAMLCVLGPDDPDDWRAAAAAVNGRIKAMPNTADAARCFEAADIYVDSFPLVSPASMFEAASLETPLVSRRYGPREARILAIDHPGLASSTLHAANEADYLAALERLINDSGLRARQGAQARADVFQRHAPPRWLEDLERAYALAAELPPVDTAAQLSRIPAERFADGEPDRSLHDLFSPGAPPALVLKQHLGMLPSPQRFALWRELRRLGAFSTLRETVRGLAPDWLVRSAKDRG